eukprot:gene8082-8913_t
MSRNTSSALRTSAYIALGSNLGDRASSLGEALKHLSKIAHVEETSFLYESRPMYYLNQPTFLNAACKVETDLSPQDLLIALKTIEQQVGREKTFQNGPRLIDLDIILYGNELISDEHLQIPHVRMTERAFVLRPLCDLAPHLTHPVIKRSMEELYAEIDSESKSELRRVIPCYNHVKGKTRYLRLDSGMPIIMGILNVTPDSFSDGGQYVSMEAAVRQAAQLVSDGANILDIGGESTRPGAIEVSVDEEIHRVVPVIKALRARDINTLISVDTRKAAVAAAAIEAGADIINDVSGGVFDAEMLPLVQRLQVPYIAMHSRGDPSNMISSKYSSYENVVSDVANELTQRISSVNRLVPRWLQIIDPGVGFAKTGRDNITIMDPAKLKDIKQQLGDRPLLIGLSRKRFLGSIAESSERQRRDLITPYDSEESSVGETTQSDLSISDRDLLSAGAHCVAVLGKADILRVHDVKTTRLVTDSFSSFIKGDSQSLI